MPPANRDSAAAPFDGRLQDAERRIQSLERELAQARALAEARVRLLADVSHELRTPLNAVLGMAGLLLDGGLQPEQRDRATTILQAAGSLLRLVGDLMDYARIEAGRLPLDPQPLDLRAALETALDLVAADAAAAGLDLTLDIDPAVPDRVIVDGARLRQILANLLSNAVKFTPRGEVHVRVESQAYEPGRHAFHLIVRDTGIGMEAEVLERIFQPFTQAGPEAPGAGEGLPGMGLGLAISRQLAGLLGGTLWAESRPGQGSAFHLRLGLELAGDDQRPLLSGPQTAFQNQRILVVDDNDNNRRILERLLTAWGAAVTTAEDAAAALSRVADRRFDLIILDMQMPRVDGISLARTLRSMGRTEPMVLLSSLGTPEAAFQDLGFRAVLTKPVKFAQLHQALARVLAAEEGSARAPAAAPATTGGVEAPRLDAGLARRLPRRILVIEDQPANQALMVQLLRRLGYEPDLAADGLTALRMAQRQPYDLLLVDLQLPGMGGLTLSRELRRGGASAGAYLAAVTAAAGESDRQAARDAGLDDFLSKPYGPEALVALIERSSAGGGVAEAAADLADDESQPQALALRLEQLFGGTATTVLREILQLYLSDCDEQIARLQVLQPAHEGEELLRRVHALKGCHRNLGLTAFAARCARLEDLLAAATPEARLRAELADLAAAYGRLRAALLATYGPWLAEDAGADSGEPAPADPTPGETARQQPVPQAPGR